MNRTTLKQACALAGLLIFAALATAAGAQDLNALATRGETLARQNPLSAELRNREPNSSTRRGFCIGMAAAEGHTSPGAGKDKIRTLLNGMEQSGFDRGVLFSIDRNRNADFAKVGATIATKVPAVAEARIAENDPFFWLGFDIATGIFGDPKLGAKGNTAIGAGSLKIRDALGAGAQRGFNASVKLLVKPVSAPGDTISGPIYKRSDERPSTIKREYRSTAPFISDVQVVPGTSNVVFSFRSTQTTLPLIEIGKTAPTSDRGIFGFGFNSGAFGRFVQMQGKRRVLDLDVAGQNLEVATTYYYIINVFNDDKADTKRPREQITGKFTTLNQSIKVVWEKILVIDDSDDLSTGEISWGFFANYGQPGAKSVRYQNLDMDSGEIYFPNKSFVMENAPDRISLGVRGEDDDGWGSPPTGIIGFGPASGPGDTEYPSMMDVNGAKGEFDLSDYPGTSRVVPFRLDSPHGSLKFVIFGVIEITRPKP